MGRCAHLPPLDSAAGAHLACPVRRASLLSVARRGALTLALAVAGAPRAGLGQAPAGAPPGPAASAARVDSNVVYGTYSGLALLMDVYHPARPTGLGVMHLPGIGWTSGVAYGTDPFNKVGFGVYVQALLDVGFTVFRPLHRTTPRFAYPGPVEDVARAARFIRRHAARYGVRADRLGGWGTSSGGYMVSMLGVRGAVGDRASQDPVERQSSKLACVVALAAPTDLVAEQTTIPELYSLFAGAPLVVARTEGSEERRPFRDASPLTHVSPDDAAFYLVHGDADEMVPFAQSERLAAALRRAGRPAVLRRVAGAGHQLQRHPGASQVAADAARWLAECLRRP